MVITVKAYNMRNVIALLLLVTLCSNECNSPYRAKIVCRNNQEPCQVQFDSLKFLMKAADLSWWKGSMELNVFYTVKNTSLKRLDSLNYNRFSVVSSSGITFHQTHREIKVNGVSSTSPGIYGIAADRTIDSTLLFYTTEKYSKKGGMKILKSDRFFFLYSHGITDTLFTVIAADPRIE
jgi:hypothetical protein